MRSNNRNINRKISNENGAELNWLLGKINNIYFACNYVHMASSMSLIVNFLLLTDCESANGAS